MRVFVTGASGFVGRAVVQELLSHHHTVLGLVRTDESAQTLADLGAESIRGDLEDLGSLKRGAETTDGVIHLAFVHDFTNYIQSLAVDRAAISALGEALANTGKPLVIASGTMMLPKGVLGTEDSPAEGGSVFAERAKAADLVYGLAKDQGVRGIVVRLAPTVHGKGDKAFVAMFIGSAREKGVANYVGDGSARWPAVHRVDAAALFRLALERGKAGATYHAVAEEGIPMKDIMGLIGKRLALPVEGKSMEDAVAEMGFFAYAMSADNPTSSVKTREELGWKVEQVELLKDMEENYFS